MYSKNIKPSYVHIFDAAHYVIFDEISVLTNNNTITFSMKLYDSKNDEILPCILLDRILQEIININ